MQRGEMTSALKFCSAGVVFNTIFFFNMMRATSTFIKLKAKPSSENFFELPEASRCAF